MEVAVAENKEQRGKGRVGTLENPETYENVPGHVIPIIEREFDDFDNEAEQFLSGELEENQFIGFRLKQGVYGQRQPDVQMIRIKLPFGGVTPEQMDVFASVVEKYAPLNKGHITTRQNIQIHHVPLRDTELLLREIAEAGLSSREGCGNTVRNVTGDPWAGVAADEVFDPTALRHRLRPLLRPSPDDAADAAQDQDLVHRLRRGPGDQRHPRHRLPLQRKGRRQGLRGPGRRRHLDHGPRRPDPLRVRRGRQRRLPEGRRGRLPHLRPPGLAARQPRPRPDQGPGRQDRHGRVPRAGRRGAAGRLGRRARIRPRAGRAAPLQRRRGGQRPRGAAAPSSPNGDRTEFERFLQGNVQAQRQEGFSTVEVKVTRGDLTPEQFRGLAQIMREYSGGAARSTVQQNFVLRWVRDEALYDV